MIIDMVTDKPIVCPNCKSGDHLSIIQFVYGSRVDCDDCGVTVA